MGFVFVALVVGVVAVFIAAAAAAATLAAPVIPAPIVEPTPRNAPAPGFSVPPFAALVIGV